MIDPARIAPALSQIDPQSRALIELFYRRGLEESDIEDMLGIAPGELMARRTAAEIEFSAELGVGLGELQAELLNLADDAWAGRLPPPDEPEPPRYDEPEQPPEGEDADAGRSRLGLWVATAIAGLAIAVIVLVVVVANGGDDDDSKPAPQTTAAPETTASETVPTQTTPTETTPAATSGPVVEFQRLNGTNGKGTAQVTGAEGSRRLRLKVRDFLEPQGGGYAVWLYNSPDDAKLLQATERTDFDVSLDLPGDYENYRFVDVSREADSNPGHMGLSLLRAPFTELEAN